MFENILQNKNLIFYVLMAEVCFLCLLQIRTNILIKRITKIRKEKKETVSEFKKEIKNGTSEIPVVKFEKTKNPEKKKPEKHGEKQADMKEDEMAVLQELMSEFFG